MKLQGTRLHPLPQPMSIPPSNPQPPSPKTLGVVGVFVSGYLALREPLHRSFFLFFLQTRFSSRERLKRPVLRTSNRSPIKTRSGLSVSLKFFETVKEATGKDLKAPKQLKKFVDKEEKFDILENNISIVKKYILNKI